MKGGEAYRRGSISQPKLREIWRKEYYRVNSTLAKTARIAKRMPL
jgi:hypothetical protein